jgi:glycosyltransferase involved in cell wall biosynthesis
MRNAERFVEETLRSILPQAAVELEVVVVDDGSTDRSADVVARMNDPRVKVVPGPRQGIAAALNSGLAHATGDYFCRCDADDFYEPDRFRAQLDFLESHPEFGAVCGQYTMVSASGKLVDRKPENADAGEITDELRAGRGRTHLCTFMVRMSLLRQLNGFRPYFIGTEDNDFQLRLGDASRVWYEPVPRYVYRLHGESITHTQPTEERKFLERMAREFQLQRQTGRQDDLDLGRAPPVPKGIPPVAEDVRKHVQDVLIGRAWKEHSRGKKWDAFRIGLSACLKRPIRIETWRSLAALVMKRSSGGVR